MKKTILIFSLGIGLVTSAFGINDSRLLRFPDINKHLIVFVYAGDIWSVSSLGGVAQKLTSHEGLELFPKISPDGQCKTPFRGQGSKPPDPGYQDKEGDECRQSAAWGHQIL